MLHPAVLGEAPRELLGGLLRFELGELCFLVGEQVPGLQLEQRRDQDEELAAGVEVELVALGEPLDEGDHDSGHVDLGRLDRVLEQQRQEKVERPLECVEVQLQVADGAGHTFDPNDAVGRASGAPWATARAGCGTAGTG